MDNARYVEDDSKNKKRDFGKKKDGKKDKKDRGYTMFAEDDSAEESLVAADDKDSRPQSKLKKHSKPSFKFVKKEKSYKPKDKEKEEKKKDEKKKEDKFKLKKKRILSEATKVEDLKPLFGVPLALVVSRNKSCDGIQLPAMFRECIDYIEEFGLTCEGIYRISGVKSKVQALKDAYNKGVPVSLQEYEPNVVAGLVKQFLRELPEPVLTAEMTPKFEQASTIKSVKQRVGEFQRLIELLPTPNRLLLSWVIIHMTHVIAKEKQNKMSMQNISIVLSPTMQISHRVLNILFTYSKILFKDTVIRKYVPPLRPVTSKWSLELPESPSCLHDELRKQELLLDELHKDITMGVEDAEKEERLWEVQRVITGLKRKLKLIKKSQQSPSFKRSLERSKEISHLRAEPPKHLSLKLGGEELDLRCADTLPVTIAQPQTAKTATKSDTSPTANKTVTKADTPTANKTFTKPDTPTGNKTISKRVVKKPVSTPTKDSGMDIGDIEMDISAMSHSQKERADSTAMSHLSKESADVTATSHPPKEGADVTATSHLSKEGADVTATSHPPKESADVTVTSQSKSESKTASTLETNITKDTEVILEKVKSDAGTTVVVVKDRSSESEVSSDKAVHSTTHQSAVNTDSDVRPEVNREDEQTESDVTQPDDVTVTVTLPSSSAVITVAPDVELSRDNKQEVVKSETVKQEVTQHEAVKPETVKVKPEAAKSVDKVTSLPKHDLDDDESETIKTKPVTTKYVTSTSKQRKASAPAAMASQHIADSTNQTRFSQPQDGVAADELAAALSQLASNETEEDVNQRIMSEFVADFGIEKAAECDEEYEQLMEEYTALLLEEEELAIIGDELRSKIESEQYEAERLDEELDEIRAMREDLYSSDEEKSDSSDSDEEEDEETLIATLNKLVIDNAQLQADNEDLSCKICQEVQDCLKTKVQIRMIQQKQLESSKNNELDLLL